MDSSSNNNSHGVGSTTNSGISNNGNNSNYNNQGIASRHTLAFEDHQKVIVTEGQLKWAQFHYKRRAQGVRQKVHELWQTPATVSDVEGAQSDDGNTTEESVSGVGEEQSEQQQTNAMRRAIQQKQKTPISRGRRAMLRVSKRAFAKRQEEFRKYGFRSMCDNVDLDGESSGSDEDYDKALAAKYADETAWKKARRNRRQSRRRRRRRKAKSTDEERLRRFENAFRAMMMSLAASQQPQHPEIATPTKIWSRPGDAPAFVSIDGRQYLDLKWGVSASNEKVGGHVITTTDFASISVDPSASWLIHIPSKPTDRNKFHHYYLPTNAQGEILVPENANNAGGKMIPVALGSEKFNEIVGALQQQAAMSQQQMQEQMELLKKHHSTAYKWHVTNGGNSGSGNVNQPNGGDENDDDELTDDDDINDDDDDEEAYALDPENLKTLAAQYLTEFVANADEEHLIAALGEKYRDNLENLVEAASDGGTRQDKIDDTTTGGGADSKDTVRRYLQGMQQSPNPSQNKGQERQPKQDNAFKNDEDDEEEERKSAYRNQMASFAGIAARYLDEVSRPRKIERTVKATQQEQSLIVSEMKAFLENLMSNETTADPPVDHSLSSDKSIQSKLEWIIASFIVANKNDSMECHTSLVVSVLQQREGREFSQVVIKYLTGIRHSAMIKKKARENKTLASSTKPSRGSIASRYIGALAKENPVESSSDALENETVTENVDENLSKEQKEFEQIAMDFLGELHDSNSYDRRDIFSELRQERRIAFSKLVSNYMTSVVKSAVEAPKDEPSRSAVDSESKPEETHDSFLSPSAEDVFANSVHVLKQLGTATEQQETNQRVFEAISARYLSSLSQTSEDAVFAELGKIERQSFSRIVTKYLEERMEAEKLSKDSIGGSTGVVAIENDGIVSIYLASLRVPRQIAQNETAKEINDKAVETIISQYCTSIYPGISTERNGRDLLHKENLEGFSRLVASYLAAVSESLATSNRKPGPYAPQKGEVQKILDSLKNAANAIGNAPLENEEPSDKAQVETHDWSRHHSSTVVGKNSTRRLSFNPPSLVSTTSVRRSGGKSEGVAARYLAKVVDDCDDDDIFAELRKQDSPRFVDDTMATKSPEIVQSIAVTQEQANAAVHEASIQSDVEPPNIEATKFSHMDHSSLHSSISGYLTKIRTDCVGEFMSSSLGRLNNREEDRAQFARGVTDLLLGVNSNTVVVGSPLNKKNRKGSRASASKYLAAMRGLSEESDEDQKEKPFESIIVNQAAEMLAYVSDESDQEYLSWAMKKLGKDDSENFAELVCRYLDGSLIVTNDGLVGAEEDDIDDLVAVQSWKSRKDEPELDSEVESDYFADIRRREIEHEGLPYNDPYTEAERQVYRSTLHNENSEESPLVIRGNQEEEKENVLKHAFNNNGESALRDHSEEKKTNERFSPSPSFEDPNFDTNGINYEEAEPSLQEHSHVPFSPSQNFNSPSRSYASNSEFSPERLRGFHQSVMERSRLIGDGNGEQTIIDTDGTTSEASDSNLSTRRLAGLMLSPTILTKRHRQAVQAIEKRKWDQVTYLLSANPWLAEMPEIGTNQFLLHKIAFYGAGDSEFPEAPEQLCLDLVKMYPAVQKFDKEGNLPLHMASAAGNIGMLKILGDRFPSGASVRNEVGMLPLHLGILSYANRKNSTVPLIEIIRVVLGYFPGALAVADSTGNLPLHIAAQYLSGDDGVDVINLILDEADKQLKMPTGIRFRNKMKVEETESVSATTTTASATDISVEADNIDEKLPPAMVVNDAGDTPLWVAIRRRAGPEIIEALAIGPGGRQAALKSYVSGNNNSLHLLLGQHPVQASVIRSILKVAPEVVLERNMERMIPIEVACTKRLPSDIVLELLLADLPVFLADKACITLKEGGESWWYLVCETNDRYIEVVEKLIAQCTYQQVHELCFMTRSGSRETLISCASPQCGEFLTVSLLFVGRFEFLGSSYAIQESANADVRSFDALDYGTEDCPYEEGRRVSLRCYTKEEMYKKEIASLRRLDLDFNFVQQVSGFVVGERDSYGSAGRQQFCIAVEQPSLSLDRVVAGMLKNDACKENSQLRQKYVVKIFSVLRMVARALQRLHTFGVVHGNVRPEACGKFGETWKILGTLKFQIIGEQFDTASFGESIPPEALEPQSTVLALDRQAVFRTNVDVDPSIDIWGFGKLAFDVLVGEPLVPFDHNKEIYHDHTALLKILHWSTLDLVEARRRLRSVGVPDTGVDFITKCLSQDPGSRPSSMNEILRSNIWDELQLPESARRAEASNNLHEC